MIGRVGSDPPTGSGQNETRILFVSHIPNGPGSEEVNNRFGPDIDLIDFSALTADILQSFAPHFVVSPILTPSFDILELAQLLYDLKFEGGYRILVDAPLPRPDVVLREVGAQCPGLDVDFLTLGQLRG